MDDYKPLTPEQIYEKSRRWENDVAFARTIERAAIENYLAQKGQPFPLLAADHKGMRVDYSGMLHQAANALVLGHKETGLAEMLRQLQEHLTELGLRWYGGDTAVVDELLQLYCVCKDSREFIRNRDGAAPTPPAPQDAQVGKDAERYRALAWAMETNDKDARLVLNKYLEPTPSRETVGKIADELIAIAAAKGKE